MNRLSYTILVSSITAICTTLGVLAIVRPYVTLEHKKKERARLVSKLSHRGLSSAAATPNDFIQAASKGTDAVVYIESKMRSEDDTYFTRKVVKNSGSGVIIDGNGTIVTNYHVVKDALEIKVTLNDRKEYLGKLVGHDVQTDLAILEIEASQLPYLPIGNSDALHVGEWILAIGNPFQLQSSVTAGVVSAKARSINLLEDHGIEAFIQTDAAVNSGNSGGALINTRGELVGINTAILSSTGGYQGFSFAIPINLVSKVVKDILQYGVVQRGWLGVTVKNVTQSLADELGLSEVAGVCVEMTSKDGAAQKAGLLENDVIVSINNHTTKDLPSFMEQLSIHRPGDVIEIKYIREGLEKTQKITLHNMLNSTELIAVRKDEVLKKIGLEVRDLTKQEVLKYGAKGVYVVSILHNSPIDGTNMTPGYIITSLNNNEVHTAVRLVDLLKTLPAPYNFNGIYEQYSGQYPYTLERVQKKQ